MKREDHIEHEVRKRLAEALSQQGMGQARISIEVLYMLPPDFIDAYSELYNRALRLDIAVSAGDPDSIPVKQGRAHQIGPAVQGKKYREHWQIADEQAFARKRKVDRELRRLVGKMRRGDWEKGKARCGGCGRWVELRWAYCAYCGGKLSNNNGEEE